MSGDLLLLLTIVTALWVTYHIIKALSNSPKARHHKRQRAIEAEVSGSMETQDLYKAARDKYQKHAGKRGKSR